MPRLKKSEVTPEMASTFYKNFKLLCQQHGESIRSCCQKLGISPSTTVRWKNGSNPDTRSLKKISDHFNIGINDLLGFQAVGASMVLNDREIDLVIAYHMMSDVDRKIINLLVSKYDTSKEPHVKQNED